MKKIFLFLFIGIFIFATPDEQKGLITQEMKSFGIKQKSIDLYWDSINLLNSGNKEYVKVLEKSIEADPKNYFALDDMGIYYRRLNNSDKALEYYKKSIAVNPENPFPYFNAGVAYMYKNDFVNAEKIYKQLTAAVPDYPEGYYGLTQVYLYTKNYTKALEFVQKAREKYKNLDTGKYFEEALRKDSHILDCNYLEGIINYELKNYTKTVDGFFNSFENMKATGYREIAGFAKVAYSANEEIKNTNPKEYEKNLKKFKEANIRIR